MRKGKAQLSIGRSSRQSHGILVISDLHVGSMTAICSDAPYLANEDNYRNPNKIQRVFFDFWNQIPDRLYQRKDDIAIFNGDLIDGQNRKAVSNQTWSTNLDDQVEDAVRLINMLPYHQAVVIRGSGYHVTSNGVHCEEQIARLIHNGRPYSAYFYDSFSDKGIVKRNLKYTDVFMFGRVGSTVFTSTHHVPYSSSVLYRSTPIAKEMAIMEFERGKMYIDDKDHPSIHFRSHCHYFNHVEFGNSHGIITPCWKYADEFLYKRGLAGTTPAIGAIEVIIEQNGQIILNKILMKEKDLPKVQIIDFTRREG